MTSTAFPKSSGCWIAYSTSLVKDRSSIFFAIPACYATTQPTYSVFTKVGLPCASLAELHSRVPDGMTTYGKCLCERWLDEAVLGNADVDNSGTAFLCESTAVSRNTSKCCKVSSLQQHNPNYQPVSHTARWVGGALKDGKKWISMIWISTA